MSNQELNTDNCTSISPACPIEETIYGYYPSLGANAWGVGFFGLCLIVNIGLGWRFKTWTYMLAMVLATFTSSLGYVGRVIMHNNPWDETGFMIQIILLTFSPAFNSAAIVGLSCAAILQLASLWPCHVTLVAPLPTVHANLSLFSAVPDPQAHRPHLLRTILPDPTTVLPLGLHQRRCSRLDPTIRRRRHRCIHRRRQDDGCRRRAHDCRRGLPGRHTGSLRRDGHRLQHSTMARPCPRAIRFQSPGDMDRYPIPYLRCLSGGAVHGDPDPLRLPNRGACWVRRSPSLSFTSATY